MNLLDDPRIELLGNSSIGIFGFSTNSYAIVPPTIKESTYNLISNQLKVPVIQTSIANSNLIGLYLVGDVNNLIVPDLIQNDEYKTLEENLPDNISIHVMDSKITALGNSIVICDKLVLVHPEFSKADIKFIEDSLDKEVIPKYLNGNPLIGSMMFATSKGFLVNPLVNEDEVEQLSHDLNLHGDVVTVNRGSPYPRLGIIANDKGILVGSDSTGPEIMRIYEVLS